MALVDEAMSSYASAVANKPDKPDDEIDEEFGFYYPFWYVYDTWIEHEEHGRYPERGGYNDQDALLMEDWKMLDRRYHRAARGLKAGDPLTAFKRDSAKDWASL